MGIEFKDVENNPGAFVIPVDAISSLETQIGDMGALLGSSDIPTDERMALALLMAHGSFHA